GGCESTNTNGVAHRVESSKGAKPERRRRPNDADVRTTPEARAHHGESPSRARDHTSAFATTIRPAQSGSDRGLSEVGRSSVKLSAERGKGEEGSADHSERSVTPSLAMMYLSLSYPLPPSRFPLPAQTMGLLDGVLGGVIGAGMVSVVSDII